LVAVFGGVLAEGGEHDAVLEGGAAEGEGLEELGDGSAIGLGVGGGSRRRVLCGGEVGDLVVGVLAFGSSIVANCLEDVQVRSEKGLNILLPLAC
jgi:hypothetical protein